MAFDWMAMEMAMIDGTFASDEMACLPSSQTSINRGSPGRDEPDWCSVFPCASSLVSVHT